MGTKGKSLSEQPLQEDKSTGPRWFYDSSFKHSESLVGFNHTGTLYFQATNVAANHRRSASVSIHFTELRNPSVEIKQTASKH